jgi:hypothetical protein
MADKEKKATAWKTKGRMVVKRLVKKQDAGTYKLQSREPAEYKNRIFKEEVEEDKRNFFFK